MTAPEGNEKRYSLQQMPSNSNLFHRFFFSLCYRSYFGMYYCAATFPVCPNWIQIGINRIYNSNFKTNSPVPSTKLFNLEMNFVLISSQWQRKHAPDWKEDDETTNTVEKCNRIFQMKDKQWHGVQCTARTIIKIDVDNKKNVVKKFAEKCCIASCDFCRISSLDSVNSLWMSIQCYQIIVYSRNIHHCVMLQCMQVVVKTFFAFWSTLYRRVDTLTFQNHITKFSAFNRSRYLVVCRQFRIYSQFHFFTL